MYGRGRCRGARGGPVAGTTGANRLDRDARRPVGRAGIHVRVGCPDLLHDGDGAGSACAQQLHALPVCGRTRSADCHVL